VASLVLVIAAVFGASAHAASAGPTWVALDGAALAGDIEALAAGKLGEAVPVAACTKMQASDVAWVTLDDEGDVDEQVDHYPAGANVITPLFEYNCVPKKTTIVSVFSLDGEVIYSDKESLKASNGKNRYVYPLGTTDETPMDEGIWGVEFFNNKTLLTSGEIELGGQENGDDPAGNTARVEGSVSNNKSGKPIEGATILVLTGTDVDAWIDAGKPQDNVVTAGRSDSTGAFALQHPLEREVPYALVVVAKGFRPLGANH
jgi:hypothetical protein